MNDEVCAQQKEDIVQKHHAAIAMFVVLLLSYILNSIDRSLFSILTIEVRDAMSLSLPQVGLASTVFTLGMGFAGLPTGYLLSIMSRRAVVLLGLFVFSVATLLTAYAKGLPDLLAYRFISGLGEAMQVTALIAIGASYFYKRRALITGTISFAYGIGSFVGPSMTASLLNTFDWKMPFIVFGLAGIVMMAIVALGVRLWFSESKANEEHANGDHSNHADLGATDTIWNPTTILLGLASICAGVAVYGFSGLYPTYLRSARILFAAGCAGDERRRRSGFSRPLRMAWRSLGYQKVLIVALPLRRCPGIFFTELDRSVILHAAAAIVFGIAVLSLSTQTCPPSSSIRWAPPRRRKRLAIYRQLLHPSGFRSYLLAQLKEISTDCCRHLADVRLRTYRRDLDNLAGTTRRRVMSPVRT
jgi:MFS family permease